MMPKARSSLGIVVVVASVRYHFLIFAFSSPANVKKIKKTSYRYNAKNEREVLREIGGKK